MRRVLKKPDLEKVILKNCRPVANIPLMAAGIEKVVADQKHFYLETNHLLSAMQSAYQRHHSTKYALFRVMNDVLNH